MLLIVTVHAWPSKYLSMISLESYCIIFFFGAYYHLVIEKSAEANGIRFFLSQVPYSQSGNLLAIASFCLEENGQAVEGTYSTRWNLPCDSWL